MKRNLTKYFTGELVSEEKVEFMKEVNHDEELREEFLEYQNLITLVNWTFPKKDEELAQCKLSEFMRKMEKRNNK